MLFPVGDANPPVEVHVKDAETGKEALGGLWPLFWSRFFDTWGYITSSLGLFGTLSVKSHISLRNVK